MDNIRTEVIIQGEKWVVRETDWSCGGATTLTRAVGDSRKKVLWVDLPDNEQKLVSDALDAVSAKNRARLVNYEREAKAEKKMLDAGGVRIRNRIWHVESNKLWHTANEVVTELKFSELTNEEMDLVSFAREHAQERKTSKDVNRSFGVIFGAVFILSLFFPPALLLLLLIGIVYAMLVFNGTVK